MKALSFRQPWAELVLQGRKTLDLRTYGTTYRGRLAIHAAQAVEADQCLAHGLAPADLPAGALVGTVELVDARALTPADYEARSAEHLAGRHYREGLYGWELAHPQRLPEPRPARGRTRLFEVDLASPEQPPAQGTRPAAAPSAAANRAEAPLAAPADVPFVLLVVPDTDSSYGLTLKQRVVVNNEPAAGRTIHYGAPPGQLTTVASLSGYNLRAVAGEVLDALRQAGYKPTDLSPQRRRPFHLPEPVGVRLGLLFLAVRPLSKMARLETIVHGLGRMPGEELYYWYSKCTAAVTAERAQKALRVLLAAE